MAPKAKTKAMQKRAPAFGATQPKRLKLTPAQARLKELYDKAWQNADGKGKQILTEVAALGYYPIDRPLGPTVERFLSCRLERIVGDASPHLSSYLDALCAVPRPVCQLPYESSYDGKQLNRTTDEMFIAETLIQDLKSFAAQHKRMPRESEVRVKSIGWKRKKLHLTQVVMTRKGMTLATQMTSPMEILIPQLDLDLHLTQVLMTKKVMTLAT